MSRLVANCERSHPTAKVLVGRCAGHGITELMVGQPAGIVFSMLAVGDAYRVGMHRVRYDGLEGCPPCCRLNLDPVSVGHANLVVDSPTDLGYGIRAKLGIQGRKECH